MCSNSKALMQRLLLLFFLLISELLFAQEYNIQWGEEIKTTKSEKNLNIVGSDESGFYATKNLSYESDEFILEKYSLDSLKRISKLTISLPVMSGKTMNFEEIFFIQNKFYLFSSFYNSSNQYLEAYCSVMDVNGQWIDLPYKLDELFIKKRNSGFFEFTLSNDKTKILVYHDSPFEKKSNESFSFKVYDQKLDLIWKKHLELPYSQAAFEINDYLIDNSGNIYMISGIKSDKKQHDKNWNSHREKNYVLLTYDWQQNKLKEFDIALQDKWIMSLTFGMSPEGNLAIGGFYSKDQQFTIGGTFFFSLDGKTKKALASGLMSFDSEFLRQFMSEKKLDQGKELTDFYFDEMIIHDDGSLVMVAEQYFVTEHVVTDPYTGVRTVSYFHNYYDIIVIKVNNDGTIAWANRIPKRQSTSGDNGAYSSYILHDTKDETFIMFNDHHENTEILATDWKASLKVYTNQKKSETVVIRVDDSGVMERKSLFNRNSSETILKPKLYYHASPEELILYGYFRKAYKFGKLGFE